MKTKINLSMLIVTSLICLLPLLHGLAVYDYLPDRIGIPLFGLDSDGNYNKYGPKYFPAINLPLYYLAFNIVLKILMPKLSNWEKYPKELLSLIDWLVPIFSLFTVPITLFHYLGVTVPVFKILALTGGIIYIIFGNYMPKVKHNNDYKMKILGILNDPDTSNNYYRKGGYLHIICGIILVGVSFFLPESFTLFIVFLAISALILVISLAYLIFLNTSRKIIRN